MKGVGHAPRGHQGVPRSMSLNAPYFKEQEYIWFMGGNLNGFQDIMHFMKLREWGMPLGDRLGFQDPCHLMCLIIRNKNIYGLGRGRVFWTLSKLLCIFTFSHTNAYATKFDLGLKEVKVIPGSPFMQLMMGPRPRCYIPSFMQIGPAVPEKIFEGFYHIWAWRPSWSCDLDHPGVLRSMSLNAPYLKEQEYICFMGGDLNVFQDIMHFMKWRGGACPRGTPCSPKIHVT